MVPDNQKSKQEFLFMDFSRRTINEIIKTWKELFSKTRLAITGKVDPDLTYQDEIHLKKQIFECVNDKGGEISSRTRAVDLGMTYLHLSEKGRQKFLHILAKDFDIDREQIKKILDDYYTSSSEDDHIRREMELSQKLIPPRLRLLRQFNSLPNGFKFLIDFRANLLPIRKQSPYLKKLDADLKGLLTSWFDIGLLDLKEITWQSPASLLEKLIEYEAVHEIKSWSDLKNRLDSDRHCFAFFHNKVPEEPLIFVEVALANQIPSSIQSLLDEGAETIETDLVDTAIFYSISSTQKGLAGINLGNFLIKRVVKELLLRHKKLKHFVTLSPVPGFRKWLSVNLAIKAEPVLIPEELNTISHFNPDTPANKGLLNMLTTDWVNDPPMVKKLKPVLMRLCAKYLLSARRGKKTLDAVANFHLTNGAYLKRINWMGDLSDKGLKQSAGIMANYYYKLSDIEKNHELYITESVVTASKSVKKWLK